MTIIRFAGAILGTVCLAALAGVAMQHRQANDLRAERQRLLETASRVELEFTSDVVSSAAKPPSSELLRLRSQVSQLRARRNELAIDPAENQQLQARVAERRKSAETGLPPDYIRRTAARWVGFSTPDNTLESFLWAMQNRDFERVLQTHTPEAAEKFRKRFGERPDELHEAAGVVPGARIAKREMLSDDLMSAEMEIIPGEKAGSEPIRFRRINGEWKMEYQ